MMGTLIRPSATALMLLLAVSSGTALAQQQPPPGWGQPQQQPPPPAQGWGQPQQQQQPPPAQGWGQPQQPQQAQPAQQPDQGWGTDATAQQAPAPTPPPSATVATTETTAPVEPSGSDVDPSGGFFLRGRLSESLRFYGDESTLFFLPQTGPQLELGLVLDKLHIHVGFSVTTLSFKQTYDDGGDTITEGTSIISFVAAPGLSYVAFRSADHRGRLLLQARGLIGTISTSPEGGKSHSATVFGFTVSALGEYRLHRLIGMGIETGYGLAFSSESEQDQDTSTSMTGLFVALVGTVYFGG